MRVAVPNSQALSLLGRDLREAHLHVLLSGDYRSSNTGTSSSSVAAAAADLFLSSLVLNFLGSETKEISKSNPHIKNSTPQHIWKARYTYTCLLFMRVNYVLSHINAICTAFTRDNLGCVYLKRLLLFELQVNGKTY
ncbi:putative protein dehydration-induced 19 [Helianthus anomalus]